MTFIEMPVIIIICKEIYILFFFILVLGPRQVCWTMHFYRLSSGSSIGGDSSTLLRGRLSQNSSNKNPQARIIPGLLWTSGMHAMDNFKG